MKIKAKASSEAGLRSQGLDRRSWPRRRLGFPPRLHRSDPDRRTARAAAAPRLFHHRLHGTADGPLLSRRRPRRRAQGRDPGLQDAGLDPGLLPHHGLRQVRQGLPGGGRRGPLARLGEDGQEHLARLAPGRPRPSSSSYDVYAFTRFVADSYLGDDGGFITPTGVFMHVAGRLNDPVELTVVPPPAGNRSRPASIRSPGARTPSPLPTSTRSTTAPSSSATRRS